tara:strand:+ start:2221 stop:2454 length:234 start_codon:yes stop_codon:yes gene_type:complete
MAEEESNYAYVPSVAAAGIFIALFIILFIMYSIRLVKTRTWFCIPFLIGALRKPQYPYPLLHTPYPHPSPPPPQTPI